MRKLAILLLVLVAAPLSFGQSTSAQWTDGAIHLNGGWRVHDGDDPAWSASNFDDSTWTATSLDDPQNIFAGRRWYRLRAHLPASQTPLALLITGGSGTYEIYLNGQRVPGPALTSSFGVTYPKTCIVPLPENSGDIEIALRTFVPDTSMFLPDRGAFRVQAGTVTAIADADSAAVSRRFNDVIDGTIIHILIMLAGFSALVLFAYQPDHREYLWLGIYLIVDAFSSVFFELALSSFLPFYVNWFFGDPCAYLGTIAQIEFTFNFAGQRVTRGWRVYEGLLLLPIIFGTFPAWLGFFSRGMLNLIEVFLIVPAAFILPVLLFTWYRRGNREAAWLVIPSLLPIATEALADLGIVSSYLGWQLGMRLSDGFRLGSFAIQPFDLADLLFLFAIGVVMFFRFTRVSRDQARSAAELDAARQVQQRLVTAPPVVRGFTIESAYLPAQQVGGDFFHVRASDDGVLIVIGDVSGKGLGAAMTVSAVVGALRAMPALSPGTILAALNRGLSGSSSGGFVTCLAVQIASDGTATLANAGHPAPYRDGKEVAVESGLPLGIVAEAAYGEVTLSLAPGDTLTLLTDGVVEARNENGELFGFDRTAAVSGTSANQIAKTAELFGQEDDITVLTLRFAPAA